MLHCKTYQRDSTKSNQVIFVSQWGGEVGLLHRMKHAMEYMK